MTSAKHGTSKFPLIIILLLIILIIGCGLVGFYLLGSGKSDTPEARNSDDIRQDIPQTKKPSTPDLLTAKDETLGSGFIVDYPVSWTKTHTGASSPRSSTIQTDENIITSPSGRIQVVLKTQTNIRTGRACTSDFIKLKYLSTETTPKFNDGRFAAYVVYFPTLGLYQYHLGLQTNTDAIRNTTPETNTACNFMFGEFVKRNSSLPNVPPTYTLLSIRLLDLQAGENLRSEITEVEVANSLTGAEYEQAKQIVQSVRIE